MKNKLLLTFVISTLICPVTKCLAQNDSMVNVLSASTLQNSGSVHSTLDSLQYRILANVDTSSMSIDYYNLAVCFSAEKEVDSACFYLQKSAEKSNSLRDLILTDTDFDFLHDSQCWAYIVTVIDSMYILQYPDIEQKQLAVQLYHNLLKDQQFRSLGLKNKKIRADSVDIKNLAEVEAIIEEYGWPTFSMVGEKSALGAFLVIQHADVKTQRKYVEQVIDAAKHKEASKESVALLIKRIRRASKFLVRRFTVIRIVFLV